MWKYQIKQLAKISYISQFYLRNFDAIITREPIAKVTKQINNLAYNGFKQ